MAILFLIFCFIRICTSCSAHIKSKSKVKILEDYVVSANFDKNLALPQLKSNGKFLNIHCASTDGSISIFQLTLSVHLTYADLS